jgi:hypothetical protein
MYKWVFITLTVAQLVFTLIWIFFLRRFDRVIFLSFIIYAGGMLVAYIAFEVDKYRRRKKELIDNLP